MVPTSEKRRRVLAVVVVSPALAWTGVAWDQQKKPPIVIGWLGTGRAKANGYFLAAFKEGMAALGWKEGAQFVVEARWAEGHVDRVPALAEEIAAKKPAIIVAHPSLSVAAARKAAPDTPIVASSGDPLAAGLVTSLARPGGMITGVSNVAPQISEKHLELLVECVPKLRRVGFLADANSAARPLLMDAAHRAIARQGVEGRFADAASPGDIEPAIARLAKEQVQALVVMSSNFFIGETERILRLAHAQRWPVISGEGPFADAGALLTYGTDRGALHRRAAYYVDRILKGAKPGDLPIEQPMTFELIVNMKTAKLLGIRIPSEVMVRANRVIE